MTTTAETTPGQTVLPGMEDDLGYGSITFSQPWMERFVWELVFRKFNATKAYQAVKPNVKESTAKVEASKLMAREDIKQRVVQVQTELKRRNIITAEELLQYHSRVLHTDRRDFLKADGTPKKLSELDPETASILEFEQVQGKKGGTVTLIKIPTRHQAAVEAAKLLGANKDRLEVTGKDGGALEINELGPIERAARIAQLLNAARERRD